MTEQPTAISAEGRDRDFVTALSRGLKVLESLDQNAKGLGNTDLAQATCLPKPTIARLTHTLVQLGYIRFDKAHGTYQVTPKLLALGANVAQTTDISQLTLPELNALRDGPNPGITASLVELVGARVVFRNVVQSNQQNALWMQAGIMAHVLDTAVGRAILSASDALQQAQILEAVAAVDTKSKDDVDQLFRTAQDEYAAKGYCTGFRQWRGDVNAIALAFRLPGDFQVYGISVGGPAIYVSEAELEEIYGPLLKTAAGRITGRPDV